MTMQTLVMAHAAFGHNHFFKNNYLFRQWTNAEGILDYLAFAKRYIAACEERHGRDEVEAMLDAAHALMDQGVFRYRRAAEAQARATTSGAGANGMSARTQDYSELWRTLPGRRAGARGDDQRGGGARAQARAAARGEPALFPREEQPRPAQTGSARCCASCAISRSISIRSARPR